MVYALVIKLSPWTCMSVFSTMVRSTTDYYINRYIVEDSTGMPLDNCHTSTIAKSELSTWAFCHVFV